MPDIPASDWINAVDDISIMAFVQGIPTGSKSYYNSYALGASRIIRKNYVYGTTDGLYHEESCATLAGEFDEYGYPVSGGTIDNMFLNNIDAAKEGYYPCMKCKP